MTVLRRPLLRQVGSQLVADSETGRQLISGGFVSPPTGRLTLTTVVPVLIAGVTASATIYYTPYNGAQVPIYDGIRWLPTLFSEISLALDSDSGHTGYHQSGKNFDLFVFSDSGTVRLGSGPAWTNNTTRADVLTRLNGTLVNNASIVLRFGASAGNTVTVSANRATYVGTFRASANGQTEFSFGAIAASGTEAKMLLWNAYNRRPARALVGDSDTSWTLTTGNIRSVHASDTMRASFVTGLQEDWVRATYICSLTPPVATNATVGVGYDTNTAFTGIFPVDAVGAGQARVGIGQDSQQPLGFHFFQAIESSQGGTTTFYGDNNTPTYMQGGLIFEGWF
jgi:hypothetical protein